MKNRCCSRTKAGFICKNKNVLPYDFYLPDYDLGIECQGEQHFRPIDFGNKGEFFSHKMFEKTKLMDRGYNIIYRKNQRKDGAIYNKKIEIYTSSGIGNRIRDAQTGEYYPNLVGSLDENLFFKVRKCLIKESKYVL